MIMAQEYPKGLALSIQDDVTIEIRLRQIMDRYSAEKGERMTYAQLASLTGIAQATIESIASRKDYNPTLKTLARLCMVLDCTPGELLALHIPKNDPREST